MWRGDFSSQYAAKVIKSNTKMRQDAEDEYRILLQIQEKGKEFKDGVCAGKRRIVQLVDQFTHGRHFYGMQKSCTRI